jgi:hypothetical protein
MLSRKVTRGRRYAFLPFLYDDEAAKIREANNVFLGDGVGAYKPAESCQTGCTMKTPKKILNDPRRATEK